MNSRNLQTYRLYYEQLAGGGAVADPVTRRNFGIIHRLLTAHDRALQQQLAALLSIPGRS